MSNVITLYSNNNRLNPGVLIKVENVYLSLSNKQTPIQKKSCANFEGTGCNCYHHKCLNYGSNQCGSYDLYGECYSIGTCKEGEVYFWSVTDNECVLGGDTDPSCDPLPIHFAPCYCVNTTTTYCAVFDGDKTSLFGMNPSSTLIRPSPFDGNNTKQWVYNKTWYATDPSGNGWISIILGGRKDLYGKQNLSNPVDMRQYLSNIYSILVSKLNISSWVKLTKQEIFNTIRDKFIAYCFTSDWYRQLYDNKYKQPNSILNLIFNDYTLPYAKNLLYNFSFDDFYKDSSFPKDFKDCITKAQKLPVLSRSKDPRYKFKVTFSFSYDMFYDIVVDNNSQNAILRLNKLVQYFFGDSESKVIKNNSSTTPEDGILEFENNKIPFPSWYSGIKFPTDTQTYQYIENTTSYNDLDIVTNVNVDTFISKWSPMMFAFFSKYKQVDFTIDELNYIQKQIGLYPVDLFNDKCLQSMVSPLKGDCYNTVTENCSIYYNPPRNIPSNTIGNYIMCTESGPQYKQVCLCWSSRLAPALNSSYGDRTSMCFSRLCDGNDQKSFNLGKKECKPHCDEMWERLHSPNPATKVRNISELSDSRITDICGPNYIPDYFGHYKFNKNVLLNGFIIIFISSIIVFLYINRSGFSVKKLVIAIVSLVFSISIIIFMSYDLKCKSICKGKKQVCQSKITKIGLPDQFCSYITTCECIQDSDCQDDNCICISGTCIPKYGNRPTTTVKRWNIQYVNVISCVIFSILLPILFYQIIKKFKPTIKNIYLYSIIGLITIIPLAVIFIFFLKQEETLVFSDTCKCYPNCNGKCDMTDNGCGEKCSTCPEDKVCYNTKCCSPVCDGKTCGYDQCGGKCKCPTGKRCQEGNCINDT